jgi:flagellin
VPFSINTNLASLQAQNYLEQTSLFQTQTINEVTSGLRIVHSGDDAAGLAIANGYRSDEAVLTEGIQNANNGLATLQTIDGGMNNISELLDRASTLATESASGTFTGDRNTLNQEFQSVIGEINRQAQSIGMNQGGQFAQALSVFIGGGQGATNAASNANGTVSVDLSQAAVDAQSLGLQGVQATGAAGTDIGTGSPATTVQDILANLTNNASESTAGHATFTFSGPGFGDSNKISISVDLAGVTDTATLTAAINTAIQNAGTGATQYATAFKNANIIASTITDSQGRQQLSFSSSTTAFQVQAGDRTANALLGNFAQNATLEGTDTAPTVAAGGSFSTLSIDGNAVALSAATTTALSAGGSKAAIVNALNSDANFSAAATASLIGNQVVIQSNTNGPTSSVQVAGSLATSLGLSTTAATAAAASTGASLNTTVTGATPVSDNAVIGGGSVLAASTVIGAGGVATNAVLTSPAAAPDSGIGSLNGGTGTGADTLVLNVDGTLQNVNINAGDATLAAIVGDINNAALNPGLGVTASISNPGLNQQLVFTSKGTPGASDSITVVAAGTSPELLAGAPLGFSGGETASGTNAAAQNNTLNVTVGSGAPVPITIASGTYTPAQLVTQLNARFTAASVAVTASLDSTGRLVLTANQPGQSLTLNTSAGSAYGALGLTAGSSGTPVVASSSDIQVRISGGGMSAPVTLALNPTTAGTTPVASVLADLTAKVNGNGALAAAGISLTSNSGGNNLVFTDNKGEKFQVAVTGDASNVLGFGSFDADGSGNFDYATITGSAPLAATTAASTLNISINGGATTGITVPAGSSPAATLVAINSQMTTTPALHAAGLLASLDPVTGALMLSSSNGTNFRVSGSGADLGFGTSGGAYAGSTQTGAPVAGRIDSAGAYTTAAMDFTSMTSGSDTQSITVTATDANGATHSLAIPLQNNSTARTGDNIDDAIHAINTALQQSNDSTLVSIYAVKEDNPNGSESIKFMSTTQNFKVAVSSLSDGSGITPPSGGISTATQNGTGADVSIDTIPGAEAAINALTLAVQKLGTAQAAVGKGENLLNYATNLAQSQLTDEASSESDLRDANLAQEAANLMKAQILMQAGTAALAQANSAPQQLLSLLQQH